MRWNQIEWQPLAELRFASDFPAWLIVVAALGLGLATAALYLRESRSLPGSAAWLLPALRATAVVLAILLLAGPVWHRRQVVGQPAQVVFAVDRSLSMAQRDSSGNQAADRLQRSVSLLFGKDDRDGWLQELASTHLIDVIAFDNSAQSIWTSQDELAENQNPNPDSLDAATGTTTDLSTPLRSQLRLVDERGDGSDEPGRESNTTRGNASSLAMVLLTDGRESARRDDATELAWQLSQAGWQVYAVGMGSVDEPPDVGVLEVVHPDRIASDGRLAGTVIAKHFGVVGRTMKINIRSGRELVWSQTATVTEDGQTSLPFDFPVEKLTRQLAGSAVRGVDRESVVLPFEVTVSLQDDEVIGDTSNDTWAFRVAAASRDRKLLILDGSARWETRYIRNLFQRDPAWSVDTVLIGPGTDSPRADRGDEPGQIPQTDRDWARYDVVMMGEIPPDQWTTTDTEGLREFVRRGGGLIFVDGRYGRLAQMDALRDLICVQFKDAPATDNNDAILRYQRDQPLVKSIVPTVLGRSQPILLLSDDVEANRDLWQRLPTPISMPRVEAMAGVEVWAEANVLSGEAGQESTSTIPWLVTRLFGGGRVFYLATDQTWRWRYKVESQLHGRFWNQLMTAAMQPPYAVRDDYVAIGTDKIDYDLGESALLRVRLLDPASDTDADLAGGMLDSTYNPLAAPATVDALLVRDDEIVATVPMTLDDPGRKTYLGQTGDLPAGAYHVRVRASGYDASALRASAPFWVEPDQGGELDRVSVDETTLRQIVEAGGGSYVHESSADEMLKRLVPLSRGRILETDTLLWESWWVFVSIVMILAAEWWIRKKVGLL